jgi:hypothetical protein
MTSSSSPSSLKKSVLPTEGDCLNEPSAQTVIPEGLLPAYLASAFGDLYEEDGLAVFGKGLGWLSLLACFARFYADVENGHVAVMLEDNKKAKKSLGTTTVRHTRSDHHPLPVLTFFVFRMVSLCFISYLLCV